MLASGQRIFVCHSHIDNEFGTKLAQDLRHALTEDNAIFYDVMGGLHGGETWWEKIVEELTARDVFLLILSPDAMNSRWVRLEINIALQQNKFILPVLHRTCAIRADLATIQIISFLAPKQYEQAFQEILVALHLPVDTLIVPKKPTSQHNDPAMRLIQQMETAFTEHDWSDVIRKAEYLMKHMPESMTSLVYRWQAIALGEEGEEQQAQEAFEIALVLVSDHQERLTLLSDYTTLLVRQQQWAKVLQRAKEALRLEPHDPAWLTMKQHAANQLVQQAPQTSQPQKQEQVKDEEPSTTPRKAREQWVDEDLALRDFSAYNQAIRLDPNLAVIYNNKGIALHKLKRYEEALSAYNQAIRLDPNLIVAYYNKGLVLNDLQQYEEALDAFEQAIRLDPNSAVANKPIEYYTCFISYSSKDQAFANRLYTDLQSRHVRCWFAPEDLKIGDKIQTRIEETIRRFDKLLLVLSQDSISSNWVAYEVEKALDKEPRGIPNVLFPIRIDDSILTCTTSWAQNIKDSRHMGDFSRWKDYDAYQQAFYRLLRDLKANISI